MILTLYTKMRSMVLKIHTTRAVLWPATPIWLMNVQSNLLSSQSMDGIHQLQRHGSAVNPRIQSNMKVVLTRR